MTAAPHANPPGGGGPSESIIRAQLQRVGSSPQFARAPRLKRLLDYLVDHSLSGDERELLEYAVGVEVFDRGADFDPNRDTIVRVTVRRLRERLRDYYAGPGREDPVRFELPVGHYRVVFARAAPDRIHYPRHRRTLPGVVLGALLVTGILVWLWQQPSEMAVQSASFAGASPAQMSGDVDSANARVLEARARYLLDRRAPGDLELARDVFREALVLDSRLADAWSGLASTLRLMGLDQWEREPGDVIEFEAAIAAALQLDPDHPEANARRATAMYLRGRYSDYAVYLQRALAGGSPLAVGYLAGMQRRFGRYQLALDSMRRAESLAPLNYTNRWNLAVMYMEVGRFDESEKRLRQLLAEYPAHRASIRTELARLLLLRQRTVEAEALLEGLPDTSATLQARVVLAQQQGDQEMRDRWMGELFADLTESGSLYRIEALAYLGRDIEAIRELEVLYYAPGPGQRLSSMHQHRLDMVKYSPFNHSLHAHPRWLELLGAQDEPLPMERSPEFVHMMASLGLNAGAD